EMCNDKQGHHVHARAELPPCNIAADERCVSAIREISVATDHTGRPVRSRRRDRHCWPYACRACRRRFRAACCDRQPRGRRREYRHPRRCTQPARWIHARACHDDAAHQSVPDKDLPYNLFTDLTPVALIADAPEVVAISSKIPAKTLQEFAAAARADANGFSYGSPGAGSVPHLGGEVLGKAMNAKMVHVPFRGSADAAKEVAAGNIQLTLATQASVASLAEAGLIRIVAVASARRLTTLPNVPTTTEAGFPGVELSNWFGIMAPRNTPAELVSRINHAFNKAAAQSDVQTALAKQGIEPVRKTPEQFARQLT